MLYRNNTSGMQLVIYFVMTESVGKDWLYRMHIASYVCGNNIATLGPEELFEDIAKWLVLSPLRYKQFTHTYVIYIFNSYKGKSCIMIHIMYTALKVLL